MKIAAFVAVFVTLPMLIAPRHVLAQSEEPAKTALAKLLLAQARSGQPDRSLFTQQMNDGLTAQKIAAVEALLAPLGDPTSIAFAKHAMADDLSVYDYTIAWPSISIEEEFALDASGKIAGWYFKNIATQTSTTEEPAMTTLATSLLAQAQSGKPDSRLFNDKMNAGLTPAIVDSVARQLGALGTPAKISFIKRDLIGTYPTYDYLITWPNVSVREQFSFDSSGKIAGWYFLPT